MARRNAVDGISFEVKEGEIFGFSRTQRCWKSTTINTANHTCCLRPQVKAEVCGFDIHKQAKRTCGEASGLSRKYYTADEDMTGYETYCSAEIFTVFLGVIRRPMRSRLLDLVEFRTRQRER